MARQMLLLVALIPILSLRTAAQQPSTNHLITEDEAVNLVMRLPEVKESAAYVERVTKGKRHLFAITYGKPDRQHRYYWIAVGEDNGMSFVTHFSFLVYIKTGKICSYDTENGKEIDLATWRKQRAKN